VEDGLVTDHVGRPAYQQVADELRQKIAGGELTVGSVIPSTAQLTKTYGVSSTVVRAAVAQLRADGLLLGQPGKGVFVRSTPEAVAKRTTSIDDLAGQIAELRELCGAESARREELEAEVLQLRQQIDALRAQFTELAAQTGKAAD